MILDRIKSWFGSDSTATKSGRNGKDRHQGRVTYFNRRKGYGFIKTSNSDEEYFMHVSELDGQVRKGDRVSFGVQQENRGPKAVAVEVLGKA